MTSDISSVCRTYIDFEIPDLGAGLDGDGQVQERLRAVQCVPLAVLVKKPIIGFSLTDETGRRLQTLNRQENSRIAATILTASAEQIVEGSLHGELEASLWTIASGDTLAASAQIGAFFSGSYGAKECEQREKLRGDSFWWKMCQLLGESFLLIAYYEEPLSAGERRSVEMKWEDTQTASGRMARSVVSIAVPTLARSQSFHLDIPAPAGTLIEDSTIEVILPSGASQILQSDQSSPDRSHFVSSPNIAGDTRSGTLRIRLHLALSQLFLPATVALLGLLLFVGASVLQVSGVRAQQDAAVTLVVLLPGLLAAYLVGGPSHRLTQRSERSVRLAMLGVLLCSIVVGSLMAVSMEPLAKSIGLIATTLGCAGCAAFVFLPCARAFLLERRRARPNR